MATKATPTIASVFGKNTVFWTGMGLLLVISFLLRLEGTTPDVSWLIDMCDRMVRGEVAYVDIYETTPPVPTLLYMPGVLLYHMVGISAELATNLITYFVYGFALYLTYKILPAGTAQGDDRLWGIIFPAALVLFVLTTDTFAQRETYATALVLPAVGVLIHHHEKNRWPTPRLRALVALMTGLAVAIKPPLFALPIILMGVYYAYITRSVRSVYASGYGLAAVIAVFITAVSLWAYPHYLSDVTQVMREVYVPVNEGFSKGYGLGYGLIIALFGTAISVPLLCLVLAFLVGRREGVSFTTTLFSIAAAGYVIVFLMQGKYFYYHAVPAAFFGFVAAWYAIYTNFQKWRQATGERSFFVPFCLGVLVLLAGYLFLRLDDKRNKVEDLTWAANFERPTAMAISPDISLSFPLARQINARWIDRIHSQWVVHYTRLAMKNNTLSETQSATFSRWQQSELRRVRLLIMEQQPDLIFQCAAQSCLWLTQMLKQEQPDLLDNYHVLSRQGAIAVLQRNDYSGAR